MPKIFATVRVKSRILSRVIYSASQQGGTGGGPEVNTWYVNPSASGGDGSPQKPFTVNEAMAAAIANDIIFFQKGTYTNDISVSKSLHFVGQSREACSIDVTNFDVNTAGGTITLTLDNLEISSTNGITKGVNQSILTFRNCFGSFGSNIVAHRVFIYDSNIGISGNLTTAGFGESTRSTVTCTTWTLDGTTQFRHSTVFGNISAATRTLTFQTCNIHGDVNCANLTYNNTVITGNKVGSISTTVNNQASGGGVAFNALGAFNPAMTFNSDGDYDNYTLTANTIVTATGIVAGKYRALYITQPPGGTFTLQAGAGISITTVASSIIATEFTLIPGSYMIHMISLRSGPTDPTPAVQANMPDGKLVPQTFPTILSLTISADNTYADLLISEGVWGDVGASTAVLFAKLNIVFTQGLGSATDWIGSSVKQNDAITEGAATALVGGETTLRIFGAPTGTPDGQETLTIGPLDAVSMFNSFGNAMGAGETGVDNLQSSLPLSVILMSDDFNDNSVDGAKWTTVSPTNAVVAETGQQLEIYSTAASASEAGLISVNTYSSSNDLIIIQAKATQPTAANISIGFGLTLTDMTGSDRLLIGRDTATLGAYRCIVKDGGVNEINQNTGIASGKDVRIKYVPSTGAATFEYWNGSSWIEFTSTAGNADLGTTPKVYLNIGSTSADTTSTKVLFDDFFICDNDYSTQYPT